MEYQNIFISSYIPKNIIEANLYCNEEIIANIEELKNTNHNIKSMGERMALNTPIQGTSADILKKAMIEIDNIFTKENIKSKMLLQVHDELIFNVLNDELDVVKQIVKQIMENTYKLEVPLVVDIEYGSNWYEAK